MSSAPSSPTTSLLDSGSIGTTNRSRFRNPAMDALLKRGRMESAPGPRRGHYRRAQDLFQREMPFVPLFHSSVFTTYRPEVRGLERIPEGSAL